MIALTKPGTRPLQPLSRLPIPAPTPLEDHIHLSLLPTNADETSLTRPERAKSTVSF
jgi:hypothetical protein